MKVTLDTSEYMMYLRDYKPCTFEVCNKLSYKDIITGTRLYIGVVIIVTTCIR